MIKFDCLSQSDENNCQQQQQEESWKDFVGRIFLQTWAQKNGSGQDKFS
jgi:hypothetical protein